MSPPTDENCHPIASITSTSRGPHLSMATYSAECSSFGLSACRSGRAGTNLSVTALPTICWPGPSGSAPATNPIGQPILYIASIAVCVGISLSASSVSSDTCGAVMSASAEKCVARQFYQPRHTPNTCATNPSGSKRMTLSPGGTLH